MLGKNASHIVDVDVLLLGMLARSLVGSLSADHANVPRHVGIAGGPLSGLAAPGCLAPDRPVIPPEQRWQ